MLLKHVNSPNLDLKCLIIVYFLQPFPSALQDVEQKNLAQCSKLWWGWSENDLDRTRPHQGCNLWKNQNFYSIPRNTFPFGNISILLVGKSKRKSTTKIHFFLQWPYQMSSYLSDLNTTITISINTQYSRDPKFGCVWILNGWHVRFLNGVRFSNGLG